MKNRKIESVWKIYEFALINKLNQGYELMIKNEASKDIEIKKLKR